MEVDIGILGMGFGRPPGADFKNQIGYLAAVLQVMAITLTGFEAGAIAGVEYGFASIGDEHDRAPDDIDEFVFVSVPMALTGPGARSQLQQIDAELGRPAASPSRRRVLFWQGSSNGFG
jgi:hypothetical protein